MINQIDFRSAFGQLLTLNPSDISDGFIIEDIEGLGPVKATISSSSFAAYDGAQYQSSRREARNIVMRIGFDVYNTATSVYVLRSLLYRFFMTKSYVSMRFYTEDLTVDIAARVESCEPTIFTRDPGVVVSLMCFDPDFIATTEITLSGNTVSDSTETTITYPGSVETGALLTLNVDRTLSEFTIYHRAGDDILTSMDVAVDLVADDIVTISTIPGHKYARLTRSSLTSSILYGVYHQATWLELKPGDNRFRVYAVGDPIPYTLKYVPRYGGL